MASAHPLTGTERRGSRFAAVLAALLLAACAGPRFEPGSTPADAQRTLGRSTGEFPRPEGGTRLEFATGPFGRQTWMLDYDGAGRLVTARQVLVEPAFAAVRRGQSQDEVRYRLGRPGRIESFPRTGEVAWNWRYETPFCQLFYVMIGAGGLVTGSGYAPDPVCDVDDVP